MPRPAGGPGAEFGAHLRRLRVNKGLTQEQLGKYVHYSKSQISHVECGDRLPVEAVALGLDRVLDGRGRLLAAWHEARPGRGSRPPAVRPCSSEQPETPEVTDTVSFAAALQHLKLAAGVSYGDLAKHSGLPKATLHDLCRGKRASPPSTHTVTAFLVAVGVTGEDLAGWLDTLARIRVPAWGRDRLRRGAESGDPAAMHRYAEHLREIGETAGAERWRRSAAEAGSVEAMIELGTAHRRAAELDAAASWWLRAASAGDATAMNYLALLAANRDDAQLAEHWYRASAEAGSVEAMHNLALILDDRNEPEAAERWYLMAARAGDDGAMENLAAIYRARGDLPKAGIMKSLAQRRRAEG
ncbi:helix-turn-helix domain-containing protein [Phytomonospora endophytica]|uniref:Transcriptional regulator with XRE-family HTH domain n=1 Tax=Phytomonospora endophytica TaxID=714109 RepID=A0A841FS29_9ACTN|nr:helix-turn-helix domain-containing protein [Phytomonospora endophytica]MBB6036558.1 transcriptional regulator with XRE-family HTH domain [Phytomonospora endophytica]GIG65879.1 hypothetical protein Pen01_21740 [Phytomonospora endophytica]